MKDDKDPRERVREKRGALHVRQLMRKENQDLTFDAEVMKMRMCMLMSKRSAELRIACNLS